jgi:phosphoesterase RecJ-like protein
MKKEAVLAIQNLLATPKKIAIIPHRSPDGDAMGSSLGLYAYLKLKGHQVSVITPTDYPTFLAWLPNNSHVIIYTEKTEQSQQLIASADLIFCLDFNSLVRINEMGTYVRDSTAKKVMIDHHLEPEGFEDYRLWTTGACATAQLVYEFIVNVMGDRTLLNQAIASCLYTGIMTDTGSFRFRSTTSNVHRIVADLIDCGADNTLIHQMVYDDLIKNHIFKDQIFEIIKNNKLI